MKLVFPMSWFPCTVKFFAELTAMPYPNAPVRKLFSTVPLKLVFDSDRAPNHVRGPIAIPILRNVIEWNAFGRLLALT